MRTVTIDSNAVKTYDRLEIKPDTSIENASDCESIIIPSSDASETLQPEVVSWILKCHEKGAHIASIFLAAFLLAGTGLLENKTATTHWAYINRLRNQYPKIRLQPNKLTTDEGNLFCSGGANA